MSAKENAEEKRYKMEIATQTERENRRYTQTETRCYTLTGTAPELDEAERILQQLQQAGETREPRLLFVALTGKQGGVTLRTLATWQEE